MGILEDLYGRVKTVTDGMDDGSIVRDVLATHSGDILEMQREQLLEGKASSGEDIRPYYSEDIQPGGYFVDTESAQRYIKWKKEDVVYPYESNRNPDAPNLYINGKFHNELRVEFHSDSVEVNGATSYADRIISKYGKGTFGLMMSRWSALFTERGAYDELMQTLKNILYV